MPFRLKHRRAIADELARLARKELRHALEGLESSELDDDGLEEARTRLDMVRALLRLVEPVDGPGVDAEQKRLRNTAHRLMDLRDADSTHATLRKLRDRFTSLLTPAIVDAVERGLRARKTPRMRTTLALDRVTRDIRRARKSAPARIREVGGIETVRDGVSRGYAAARRRMRALEVGSEASEFHAWRRRVKDHWYHMRLFEGLHVTPRARAKSLEQLESWLGEDSDLAALKNAILADPAKFGDARATALVLGSIDKYQAALRAQALARGHRLFAAKSDRIRKSAESWWE